MTLPTSTGGAGQEEIDKIRNAYIDNQGAFRTEVVVGIEKFDYEFVKQGDLDDAYYNEFDPSEGALRRLNKLAEKLLAEREAFRLVATQRGCAVCHGTTWESDFSLAVEVEAKRLLSEKKGRS